MHVANTEQKDPKSKQILVRLKKEKKSDKIVL